MIAWKRFAAVFFVAAAMGARAQIRVVVWDERQPEQKQAYSNFLGNAIADFLRTKDGITVKSVALDDPEQGITADTLDHCDVLIMWAHKRKADFDDARAKDIAARIRDGKLSLLALHSAHWSKPFVEAMCERTREDAEKQIPEAERGKLKIKFIPPPLYKVPKKNDPLTPSFTREKDASGADVLTVRLPGCIFPSYRADGMPSHVTTLLPDHPIAKGIPAAFDVSHTEMYDDPFHVPAPDAVVFLEKWDHGEQFHSGSIWNVGKGRVVYFRPGHETFPVYREEIPLKIIENTVRFLGEKSR